MDSRQAASSIGSAKATTSTIRFASGEGKSSESTDQRPSTESSNSNDRTIMISTKTIMIEEAEQIRSGRTMSLESKLSIGSEVFTKLKEPFLPKSSSSEESAAPETPLERAVRRASTAGTTIGAYVPPSNANDSNDPALAAAEATYVSHAAEATMTPSMTSEK